MLRLTLPNELPGERREQAKQKVSSHQLRDTTRGWRLCVSQCKSMRWGAQNGEATGPEGITDLWFGLEGALKGHLIHPSVMSRDNVPLAQTIYLVSWF